MLDTDGASGLLAQNGAPFHANRAHPSFTPSVRPAG